MCIRDRHNTTDCNSTLYSLCTLRSVSYTHLDVYKRQLEGIAKKLYLKVKKSLPCSLIQPILRKYLLLQNPDCECCYHFGAIAPVSYTHLTYFRGNVLCSTHTHTHACARAHTAAPMLSYRLWNIYLAVIKWPCSRDRQGSFTDRGESYCKHVAFSILWKSCSVIKHLNYSDHSHSEAWIINTTIVFCNKVLQLYSTCLLYTSRCV